MALGMLSATKGEGRGREGERGFEEEGWVGNVVGGSAEDGEEDEEEEEKKEEK